MANERDILQDAQLRKVQSEIAKNEAEKKKYLSETAEIDKRTSKGFFQSDSVIKAVIGGIVAAALLSAWFIGYMQPILEADDKVAKSNNELLNIRNETLTVQNQELVEKTKKQLELYKRDSLDLTVTRRLTDELRQSANKELMALKLENDNLTLQQSQSKKLITEFQGRLDHLADEYQKLSQRNQATEAEKIKYMKLADEFHSKSDQLNNELTKINEARQKTEDRSKEISDQLISNWLMENTWAEQTKSSNGISYNRWEFNSDGKLLVNNNPKNVYDWQIKNGVLNIVQNGSKNIMFTAKVSTMQTTIEGNGWKMTKE